MRFRTATRTPTILAHRKLSQAQADKAALEKHAQNLQADLAELRHALQTQDADRSQLKQAITQREQIVEQ